MSRVFLLPALLLFFISFTACESEPEGTVINGDISHAENLSVFLDKIVYGKANNILERQDISGNGTFQIGFPEKLEPGVYNIRIGAKRISLILDGSEKTISLKGDLEGLDTYDIDIEGSPETQQFGNLIQGFIHGESGIEELQTFVDTVQNGILASYAAFSMLGTDGQFVDLHKKAYLKLSSDYPQSDLTAGYADFIENVEAQYTQYMASQLIKIGQPAPDLSYQSPDGKKFRLSDLKGKLVLLDFWASWCMPCRQENPNVVKVYNKYKDRGFTIYSVSLDGVNERARDRLENEEQLNRLLDRSKDRWVQAIETDGLTWPYHVSDLKQWNSDAAATYGVQAIPRTFFIDRDGKIAAINLRGAEQIESVIQKLL